MKAIFLDIDGVLNDSIAPGVMHWNSTLPVCVNNLNTLIDSIGGKVFLISSWVDDAFFINNNLKLENFLYERGVKKGSIVGFRRTGASKEDGILELVQTNESIESFVIIDDNPTIVTNEYLKSRYFKTQSLVGLTTEDVQKIIKMFSYEAPSKKDRFLGCLIGLSVGDAYGTTFEFKRRINMPTELPDDIIGGGPFDMKPGEWTDDTSMALCLAESIVEKGWDTDDQMRRYIKWWQEGYNSVKGECFDIGGATRSALSWYNMNDGRQFVQDTQAAGNGVLMRLAPVPMFCHDEKDSIFTLSHCAFQSIMTHPSSQSIECSMLMGAMINKILSGERDKMKILNFDTLLDENSKQMYNEILEKYSCHVNGRIETIKRVEYKDVSADKISGDGYCVFTLEAALWAFLSTDDFKSGLKKVVALGDDTDTTGAVYGQIAGAYYGINNIPWVEKIAWIEKIKGLAEQIFDKNESDKVSM